MDGFRLELSIKEQSKIFFNMKIGKALANRLKLERARTTKEEVENKESKQPSTLNSPMKRQLKDIITIHSKAVRK